MGSSIHRSSGFKGVGWYNRTLRWRAIIRHRGTNISIGYFLDAVDAAHAYDRKCAELRGWSAKLNFPENLPIYMKQAHEQEKLDEANAAMAAGIDQGFKDAHLALGAAVQPRNQLDAY